MKKESVNTFNGGLNFDLNPITTPNNVLTDCVNGTFITFNGDELVLQNDAGNTTIDLGISPPVIAGSMLYIPGSPYDRGDIVYTLNGSKYTYYLFIGLDPSSELISNKLVWQLIDTRESVRLSEGFYPIGIKEYGGVLYIVSAKKPILPSQWLTGIPYTTGQHVANEVLGQMYYFESKVDNNLGNIPVISDIFWNILGSEKEYTNKFGEVEFGSYPSPEIFNAGLFDTSMAFSIENTIYTSPLEFKLDLYSPQSVNDSLFQAGTYVSFQSLTSFVLSNVTYQKYLHNATTDSIYKDPIQEPDIYKVRLLHQLSNGFIDLTEDVWLKYARYMYDITKVELNQLTTKYWFTDPTFKYYCPHNFKGKLVISVELENLDIFEVPYTSISIDGVNYNVVFNINYVNTTKWNQGVTPSFTVYYTTDGTEPTLTSTKVTGLAPITLTLPMTDYPTESKTIIKYKVLPNFYFNSVEIPKIDFPDTFLNYHTRSGSQLLEVVGDDVVLVIDDTISACEVGTDYRVYYALTLQNSQGKFLNESLDVVPTKFQFYHVDYPSIPGTKLGTFNVDANNKAFWISSTLPIIPSSADTFVKILMTQIPVRILDATCQTIELTVTINKNFDSSWPITVTQNGVPVIEKTMVSSLVYKFLIKPGVAFTISPNVTGVMSGYDYVSTGVSGNTEIRFGMITDPGFSKTDVGANTVYRYVVDMTPSAFGTPIYQGSEYMLTQTTVGLPAITTEGYLTGTTLASGLIFYQYKAIDYNSALVPLFNIAFTGTTDLSWPNLSAEIVKTLGSGHLFKASYTFPLNPGGGFVTQ